MNERPFDHGELNIPLHKRRRSIDSMIDAGLRQIAKEKRAQAKVDKARRRAAREAETARPKLTAGDVLGAEYVRDQFGWHKVVRVSEKSVTVETPYSWTDRIALTKVLEVSA